MRDVILPKNFYPASRPNLFAPVFLQEPPAPDYPSEGLLQAIWYRQRLRVESLQTLDGQRVKVLHPGFWNKEAGPDFRGAVIQVGADRARTGDIEVDLQASSWHDHHHHTNPAYKDVMLHVVWDEHPGATLLPTIALQNALDAPLHELKAWLGRETHDHFPPQLRGQCCAPLQGLTPETLQEILRQAAKIRFESKAAQLRAQARQVGWGQALWQGLFGALGYKYNFWPMHRLGHIAAQMAATQDEPDFSLSRVQSRLFGIAGFLPANISSRRGPKEYTRALWDHWWRERHDFAEHILPMDVWRLAGLRPANHPHRRIALAAHWVLRKDLPAQLEQWLLRPIRPSGLPNSLVELLGVPEDPFWSWHRTIRSPRLGSPQPLLGPGRATDLAINIVLPWLWIRARSAGNREVERVAEKRYEDWPAASDNAILRLARHRLMGRARHPGFRRAANQQGLLQIVADFCEHSNALCENCLFPGLIRTLND